MNFKSLEKELNDKVVVSTLKDIYLRLSFQKENTDYHHLHVMKNAFCISHARYKEKFPIGMTFNDLKELDLKSYRITLNGIIDVLNDPKIMIDYVA